MEVESLLDVIEAKLPTGSKHWEEVSLKLYEEFGLKRNKNACQQKFFRMADVDKPTGSTFIPRHVARAKDIKEKKYAEEVVGLVARNDSATSEDGNDDDNPRDTALRGSRLVDDDGHLRRPKTKKHKANDMAGAILQLAGEQSKSTEMISSALTSVANSISGKSSDDIDSLKAEVAGMGSALAGLGSKLDDILKKLSA